MLIKKSLVQLFRAPVRMVAILLVCALSAALLCVGMNLKNNANRSLAETDAAFTTVVVPEFSMNIDSSGALCNDTSSPLYMGVAACPAPGFDMTLFEALPGVQKVDVRGRYGACVNGDAPLLLQNNMGPFSRGATDDVIIFRVDAPERITVTIGMPVKVPVSVIFSAIGADSFAPELEITNWINVSDITSVSIDPTSSAPLFDVATEFGDGSFYLEPGATYIVSGSLGYSVKSDASNNPMSVMVDGVFMFASDEYHIGRKPQYSKSNGWILDSGNTRTPYVAIAPYDEGFFDTRRGAWFQESIDACRITSRSLNAVSVGDLAAMRAFHSGGVHIAEGRSFTEGDYSSGAKVCIISDYIADVNGWELGDTVSLSFYEAKYLYGQQSQFSRFTSPTDSFFDEGEYEIVGLYSGNVITPELNSLRKYTYGEAMDALDVLIPHGSLANAPAAVPSRDTTVIRLENSRAADFVEAVSACGLTQSAGRQVALTIYDQGYSAIAPGLNELSRVSRLTLILALAAAGLAALVLAVVHVLRSRRDVAAMRSLGTQAGKIFIIMLAGVLMVCILGAGMGAYVGYSVSDTVTGRVISDANEAAADTTFTAMLGEDTAADYEFTASSEPVLAVYSGLAVAAAFLILSTLLLALEFTRPPMALLGTKE